MDEASKIENGDGYDVPPPMPSDGPQDRVSDDDPDLWEEPGHPTLPDDVNDEPEEESDAGTAGG
jgi:hypothetical protein